MTEREFTVKGIRSGVLICLPEVRCSKQRDVLIKHLQTQERFFKGGRIAVDVGGVEWTLDTLRGLLRDVADEGVCLWAILSTNAETAKAAEALELATKVKPDTEDETISPMPPKQPEMIWLFGLPDGRPVIECDGNLVLVGDLPEEREIRATGTVLIWGKATGTIRFGSADPANAYLKLLESDNPRIFLNENEVTLPKKLRKAQAVSIRVAENSIVVEADLKPGFNIL